MPIDVDPLSDSRKRIQAAFDPELVKSAGHQLADLLAAHLADVEASGQSVLNWENPPENIARASQILDRYPRGKFPDRETLSNHFTDLVTEMLARGLNLHDPRYIGHQVPASLPIAGLFDAVGSVTNQVMAIYEMGPWASAVEAAMGPKAGRTDRLESG